MTTPNATPSIFLATPCYGGLTTIAYMSSVLALQRACIERRTGLQVELGGGHRDFRAGKSVPMRPMPR